MYKNIIAGSLLALVIVISSVLLSRPANQAIGSVSLANEYHSTSTRSLPVGTQIAALTLLDSGDTTLGSVIITGAGAGFINFYDATTSSVLLRATTLATSSITLASIPPSAAAGTYTFDLVAKYGLLMEVTGTAPTSTVTYRP